MIKNLAAGLAALATAVHATVTYGQADEPEHARMKLVSEHDTLVPGATNWLGVTFEIDPGWHLYWNGQNDTGFPIKLTPKLPEGFKAGVLQWPAPSRHISPGDLLDHIYEKRVTLLLPVEVPPEAKPDTLATFSVQGEWLVCKSACVAGAGESSISLKVAAPKGTPRGGSSATLFAEARARVPKALNEEAPEAVFEWSGGKLVVKVRDAKDLAFYPGSESTLPSDLVRSGEAKGDTLEFAFETAAETDRLVGVLEVNARQSDEKPRVYWIDSRRSGANREGVGTSKK